MAQGERAQYMQERWYDAFKALCLLIVVYVVASWAIDSGSLLLYGIGIVAFYCAVRLGLRAAAPTFSGFGKTLKVTTNDNRSKKSRAKKA